MKAKGASGQNEYTKTLWQDCNLTLLIKWEGYDDPGKLSGPPEDCYPPESDMEWEIVGATIEDDEGKILFNLPIPLGRVQDDLWDEIYDQCWEWFEDYQEENQK